MRRYIVLLSIPVLALMGAGAHGAAGQVVAPGGARAAPIRPNNPGLTVLYNQQVDDSGLATLSMKYPPVRHEYDSYAADDFTVPSKSTWTVSEVDVTGQFLLANSGAASQIPPSGFGMDVIFYTALKGLPGKAIATFTSIQSVNNNGSFAITLPKSVTLKGGTYFVSVYQYDFAGNWGWENTTKAQSFGKPAAWENPGNGFKTGCEKWAVEHVCRPNGQGPDHLFSILGTAR